MEPEQSKEEKQTITKTPPPRVKNPKRVEQGKRLAAISKFAKQKKKQQQQQRETIPEDFHGKEKANSTSFLISTTTTLLGTCCTLLLTYIAYNQWSSEPKVEKDIKKEPTLKRSPVVYNDLSQYDI